MSTLHPNRRAFLVAGGMSYFGFDLATRAAAAPTTEPRKVAKSAIMIWLSGGASHIDTWDMKPDAPEEYRGSFKPVVTSAPGVHMCEHLPHLAKQARHLAVVRSLGDHRRGTGDHHAGHERWEEDLAIDELKTHQRERPVLRSKTPGVVVQEIAGLVLAHYVVRVLMSEAARTNGLSPRRLSFTGTLKILRCRLPECPKSRKGLKHWYEDLLVEIAEEVLPLRRNRINPRVIKRKMSNWPKKRPQYRRYPQPTKKFRQSIVMLS